MVESVKKVGRNHHSKYPLKISPFSLLFLLKFQEKHRQAVFGIYTIPDYTDVCKLCYCKGLQFIIYFLLPSTNRNGPLIFDKKFHFFYKTLLGFIHFKYFYPFTKIVMCNFLRNNAGGGARGEEKVWGMRP